jgi:hypothetical protein
MRFVANYTGYQHEIQTGRSRRVQIEGDQYELVWSVPHLVAIFADRYDGLPLAERQKAREHFNRLSGDEGPAYRHEGIINCRDPELDGTYYIGIGNDDAFRMSVFDTETMCPTVDGMTDDEVRALYERVLSNSPDLGHTIIRTDDAVLVAPFVRYAAMSADQLVTACLLTGTSLQAVIEYERGTEAREDVLAVLEEALEDESQAASIDAALGGEPAPAPKPRRRGRAADVSKEPVA